MADEGGMKNQAMFLEAVLTYYSVQTLQRLSKDGTEWPIRLIAQKTLKFMGHCK